MAKTFVRCIMQGYVGNAPEERTLQSGDKVVNLNVSVSYLKPGASGGGGAEDFLTRWYGCAFWGSSGQRVIEQVKVGDLVQVWGRQKAPRIFKRGDGTVDIDNDISADSFEIVEAKSRREQLSAAVAAGVPQAVSRSSEQGGQGVPQRAAMARAGMRRAAPEEVEGPF